MEYSLWRNRARTVAYVDLLLSSFLLLFTVYLLIFGRLDTVSAWVLWIIIAVLAIIILAIQMWAAVMLLKATKQEVYDHNLAMGRARIWRNVCIGVLILNVVLCFYGITTFVTLALGILLRGFLLYVVCNFMSALKIAAQAPSC